MFLCGLHAYYMKEVFPTLLFSILDKKNRTYALSRLQSPLFYFPSVSLKDLPKSLCI